jgi:hypothetical protein
MSWWGTSVREEYQLLLDQMVATLILKTFARMEEVAVAEATEKMVDLVEELVETVDRLHLSQAPVYRDKDLQEELHLAVLVLVAVEVVLLQERMELGLGKELVVQEEQELLRQLPERQKYMLVAVEERRVPTMLVVVEDLAVAGVVEDQ